MPGLENFLPVDGAFYLYADVSGFGNDSRFSPGAF